MMELQDKIAALSLLEKRVREELANAKTEWMQAARPRERTTAMIGEAELGTVSLVTGRQSWKVTDEKALLAWAMENAPHLVDYSPRLNPNYLTTLLRDPVDNDGAVLPGVELQEGNPYVAVRSAPGAADTLRHAINSGTVSMKEITAD